MKNHKTNFGEVIAKGPSVIHYTHELCTTEETITIITMIINICMGKDCQKLCILYMEDGSLLFSIVLLFSVLE